MASSHMAKGIERVTSEMRSEKAQRLLQVLGRKKIQKKVTLVLRNWEE